MKQSFKVLVNNQNRFFRHEVWHQGTKEVGTYDLHQQLMRSDVKPFTKMVKAFRTTKAAQDFISYQEAVAEFKGQAE